MRAPENGPWAACLGPQQPSGATLSTPRCFANRNDPRDPACFARSGAGCAKECVTVHCKAVSGYLQGIQCA
jgi:hypothetical protein